MISFCVHVWNEATALERLVKSSLPLADLVGEWVILDHRSDDELPDALDRIRSVLRRHHTPLVTAREERDLSPELTFADVRNRALGMCRGDVIVLLDADFVLGPEFRGFLERAAAALSAPGSRYHAASYTVPVVWDRLTTNADGVITEHGRVWVHPRRARIFAAGAVRYEQTKDGGRWERLVVTDPRRPDVLPLTEGRDGELARGAVVSVNVKPPERIALRETMTMYMQDAVQGRIRQPWLEAYRAGEVRKQPPYEFQPRDLRGWRLYAPGLELVA